MSFKQKILLVLALVVGWFLPGGSFWFVRRPAKALVLLGLLAFLVITGMVLADFRDIRFQDNPFYYMGRFGNGLVYLSCYFFMDYAPQGLVSLRYSEIGLLYICIAGALNLVVLISLINTVDKYFIVSTTDVIPDGT